MVPPPADGYPVCTFTNSAEYFIIFVNSKFFTFDLVDITGFTAGIAAIGHAHRVIYGQHDLLIELP